MSLPGYSAPPSIGWSVLPPSLQHCFQDFSPLSCSCFSLFTTLFFFNTFFYLLSPFLILRIKAYFSFSFSLHLLSLFLIFLPATRSLISDWFKAGKILRVNELILFIQHQAFGNVIQFHCWELCWDSPKHLLQAMITYKFEKKLFY